jgi:3-dehydroquinate synthetase
VGKTAVDVEQGKNLVGAFYDPRAILIDGMASKWRLR